MLNMATCHAIRFEELFEGYLWRDDSTGVLSAESRRLQSGRHEMNEHPPSMLEC